MCIRDRPYHEKKLGQLFCDNKSSDILELLLAECAEAGAEIRLNTAVQRIEKRDGGFLLHSDLGEVACQSLVIATGGLSIPTLGATGFGYQVARQFGHELLPVSYTHLDVYKRQVLNCVHDDTWTPQELLPGPGPGKRHAAVLAARL